MERLWAPWRLQYVTDTAPKTPGCFLCNAFNATNSDREHLLLLRREKAFIILNRYPYNCGHLMVVPARHIGDFEDADTDEIQQIWELTSLCKKLLMQAINAEGVNIGINQGKCSGAGVLDHLHIHIVPRWPGDTNFMPVLSDLRVIPQALTETYDFLKNKLEILQL